MLLDGVLRIAAIANLLQAQVIFKIFRYKVVQAKVRGFALLLVGFKDFSQPVCRHLVYKSHAIGMNAF